MNRTRSFLIVLVVFLLATATGCGAPEPTTTPQPTYTPAPTYTPVPTYTPEPTDTPPPPPTETPKPTDTPPPPPTETPVPTEVPEPTETAVPTAVQPTSPPPPPPTAVPPTAVPDPCAGIPADVSGAISPKCAGRSTTFYMDIWGFAANEQVGFWLDGEYGIIGGTRQTVSIGPSGSAEDLYFTPTSFDLDPGLYWWVFEGVSSGHQSVLYFRVLP